MCKLSFFQIRKIRSLALLIFGHEVTQAVLRRLIISSETRCGIVAQSTLGSVVSILEFILNTLNLEIGFMNPTRNK